MPRQELVSITPKTVAEVALFGRVLIVISLNGVAIRNYRPVYKYFHKPPP